MTDYIPQDNAFCHDWLEGFQACFMAYAAELGSTPLKFGAIHVLWWPMTVHTPMFHPRKPESPEKFSATTTLALSKPFRS